MRYQIRIDQIYTVVAIDDESETPIADCGCDKEAAEQIVHALRVQEGYRKEND